MASAAFCCAHPSVVAYSSSESAARVSISADASHEAAAASRRLVNPAAASPCQLSGARRSWSRSLTARARSLRPRQSVTESMSPDTEPGTSSTGSVVSPSSLMGVFHPRVEQSPDPRDDTDQRSFGVGSRSRPVPRSGSARLRRLATTSQRSRRLHQCSLRQQSTSQGTTLLQRECSPPPQPWSTALLGPLRT